MGVLVVICLSHVLDIVLYESSDQIKDCEDVPHNPCVFVLFGDGYANQSRNGSLSICHDYATTLGVRSSVRPQR